MTPLPEHRVGPAPVFESTAVDLFGPITFQDTINKRGNGKAWGVVFVLHCDIASACGGHRCVLHGLIPAGGKEVHGHTRGAV
jgi:hypothetical protein